MNMDDFALVDQHEHVPDRHQKQVRFLANENGNCEHGLLVN
jgi:hypothetical protein